MQRVSYKELRNHFLLPFKTALCEMLYKSIIRDYLTLGHLQDKQTRQEWK